MKKILILTLSLLTINLVSKAQVEIVSSGTSGAYAVTVPGTFVLSNGLQVTFKAHTANTAGATLSVSGTAIKNITKLGGSVNIAGSDILTNQIVTVAYDGTTWQMISAVGSTPTAPTNYWSVNGTDIYNNNAGKVGIGKSTPSSTLDAAGDINSDDVYKLDGTTFLSNWNGNVLVGYTLATSLSGLYNTFIGEGAGQNTTTPARNTFLGRYAGNSNITGSDNTSLGAQAASNANSSYNTSIGAYSNTGLTSGQYNTSLGYSSGQINTTGSYNTFLGYNADATATNNNLTNATAIGYNAKVGQSNSLVLGGTGADIVNVGIGTSTPSAKLDVRAANVTPTATTVGNLNVFTTNAWGADLGASLTLGGAAGTTYPAVVFGTIEGRKTAAYGNDFLYGYLSFKTCESGTLWERMRITDNGNIGIGTSAPGQKLEIQDGDILLSNTANNPGLLRFKEGSANGGNFISFKAPTALTSNVNYTLPINVGAANDVLSSDGAGTLSWATPAASVNIYNSNGALTGARIVTQGANTLAFTATSVNAFSVDGTTFSIDALNNYVGIGTAPALPFDVANSTQTTTSRFTNTLNSNSQKMAVYGWTTGALGGTNIGGAFESMNSTGENYGIYGNASGNSGNKKGVYASASGTGTNNGGFFASSGGTNDYGVYTIATAAGTSNAFGIFSTAQGNGTGTTYGVYAQNSSSNTGATYAGYFENVNSTGSIIYGVRSNLTGNAGGAVTKYGIRSDVIGTASSNVGGYFRAVGGTTNHALQLVDGSEANNRVLTSDAAGMATWTDLSTLTSGGATAWTRVAPNIYPTSSTDNVGIGVATPTNKLDVEGAAVIGTTFSGTNTAPTNGLLVEGTMGIGTPSPGTYGLYSAVGTSTNKKTLTVSAFGTSFVDNAPAVLEIRGGTNTVGAEVGVIDFINTSNGSIDYNFARISAHRENANATFSSLRFYTRTGATLNEAMRINENGKIGIGITNPVEILEIGSIDSDIELETYSATESSSLHIKRGRGTLAVPTVPSSGDYYGGIGFQAWDGTAFQEGARIQGTVDGVVGATDMPGRLEFWTSPDGTASAVERMRVTNGGNVGIGTTAPGTSRLNVVIPSTDATNGIGLTVTNNYTGASTKYGIDVNVDGAGSGLKYGISSSVIGLAGDASTIYGYQVAMTPNGTGGSYGIYSSQSGVGTGTRYGIYNSVANSATSTSLGYGIYTTITKPAGSSGNTFAGYFSSSNAGAGTAYGIYSVGETYDYFSGSVGIGTNAPAYQLQLSLNSAGKPTSNVWTVVSDARLKTNVHPYEEGINELMKINPVWFTYTGEANMPKETGVGVLAQELQKIAPYMVKEWTYTPNDLASDELEKESSMSKQYLGVDNGAMTYMLINAIKEQQKMIEELKKEVEALKNK